MDALISDYLTALDAGNEAECDRILAEMNAGFSQTLAETQTKLDALAESMLGLFAAANELAADAPQL